MRGVALILSCLCVVVSISIVVEAQGWHGIVPLQTTRADVERLLGQPTDPSKEHSLVYHTRNEVALIDYASNPPCGANGGWQVPQGTVVSITVSSKARLLLSDLQIEEKRYEIVPDAHKPNVVKYINKEEGESIDAFQGEVLSIRYFPATKYNHLRCPEVRVPLGDERRSYSPHSLDIYHDLPFKHEKSRLDNFAIALQQYLEIKGYIVVYAGRRARIGEAQTRAERAKNYLVNERGIDAGRIVTMDGGYREKLTVELYLVPPGATPPASAPTVDPSQVRIIKAADARNNSRRSTRSRRKN